jgi:hypothetical protein
LVAVVVGDRLLVGGGGRSFDFLGSVDGLDYLKLYDIISHYGIYGISWYQPSEAPSAISHQRHRRTEVQSPTAASRSQPIPTPSGLGSAPILCNAGSTVLSSLIMSPSSLP